MMYVEWSRHHSNMVDHTVLVVLVLGLVVGQVWGNPGMYRSEGVEQRPLAATLGQRLASHAPGLAEARGQDPRLPLPGLPSPQELDAIKKVAQILVMLGEQVIPSIIGENPPPAPEHGAGVAGTITSTCDQTPSSSPPAVVDLPNGPVKDN